MKGSYSLLRASGVLLSYVCGAIWLLTILFGIANGVAGLENEWTGDWIKLLAGVGLGQAFIAIADSAERIARMENCKDGQSNSNTTYSAHGTDSPGTLDNLEAK